ncbi:hypothetical protein HMI54_006339, partial [Coelomomyces lativittatus]
IDLTTSDTAVIVGHGNVALDITRILLSPIDRLEKTDISRIALEQLKKSRIRHVDLVGRRGPLQVSFTSAEFRELLHLPHCQYQIDRDVFKSLPNVPLDRPRQRLLQLLTRSSSSSGGPGSKSWHLRFFQVPTHVDPTGVTLTQTYLSDDPDPKVQFTQPLQTQVLQTQVCIQSLGYVSSDLSVKDLDPVPDPDGGPKVWTTGWVNRPQGTLASTLAHATYTADQVLLHLLSSKHTSSTPNSLTPPNSEVQRGPRPGITASQVQAWVPHQRLIQWNDWIRLHQLEQRLGTKVVSNEAMLDYLSNTRV